MESVPPTELSTELKEWIVREAEYVVPVMDYLRRNSSSFFTMIALSDLDAIGQMEEGPKYFHLAHPDGRVAKTWEKERESARELLTTGQLAHCPECFDKVLFFSDGQRVSWPIMGTHECGEA